LNNKSQIHQHFFSGPAPSAVHANASRASLKTSAPGNQIEQFNIRKTLKNRIPFLRQYCGTLKFSTIQWIKPDAHPLNWSTRIVGKRSIKYKNKEAQPSWPRPASMPCHDFIQATHPWHAKEVFRPGAGCFRQVLRNPFTYSKIASRRMTSGDILKSRKGDRFVTRNSQPTALPFSTKLPLTGPIHASDHFALKIGANRPISKKPQLEPNSNGPSNSFNWIKWVTRIRSGVQGCNE